MLFKDCSMLIKKLLVSAFVLQGIMPKEVIAEKIKFTNGTDIALGLVLVRTEKGSKYNALYEGTSNIKARVLLSGKSTTLDNFPSGSYDRVLWIVPLKLGSITSNLKALGTALYDKSKKDQPLVKAFEVGSAQAVSILGSKDSLKIDTTGKLTNAAKEIVKSAQKLLEEEQPEQQIQSEGYAVDDLLAGNLGQSLESSTNKFADAVKRKAKAVKYKLKGNPKGWPKDEGMSFGEVVDVLGVKSAQESKLKKFKDLSSKEQSQLKSAIRDGMKASTYSQKEKAQAYAQLLKYTNPSLE